MNILGTPNGLRDSISCTESLRYCYPPDSEGRPMEFRLTYKGKLPAEASESRKQDKIRIRGQIHPQIKELTRLHPSLRHTQSIYSGPYYRPGAGRSEDAITFWEQSADLYKIASKSNHIHRFAPLITRDNYNGCHLDILFLRRDMPGGVVKHGGDIDNRLKVLFDALQMPQGTQEINDVPQCPEENPCFCLLADDGIHRSDIGYHRSAAVADGK